MAIKASTVASSYEHTHLCPIKTNHLRRDSTTPESRLLPYSPLSEYVKLWHVRVGLRNQEPTGFFIGVGTMPPLFGDLPTSSSLEPTPYCLTSENANREAEVTNTNSFRRCGAWDIVEHAIQTPTVGAGVRGDDEVERKEEEE
jgi:hypothetical protein